MRVGLAERAGQLGEGGQRGKAVIVVEIGEQQNVRGDMGDGFRRCASLVLTLDDIAQQKAGAGPAQRCGEDGDAERIGGGGQPGQNAGQDRRDQAVARRSPFFCASAWARRR